MFAQIQMVGTAYDRSCLMKGRASAFAHPTAPCLTHGSKADDQFGRPPRSASLSNAIVSGDWFRESLTIFSTVSP